MSGLHANTTITVRGGTFTAAPEPRGGDHACTGCAGHGRGRSAICEALPIDVCANEKIIWVAGDDPATITALAEFMLEAS